MKKTKKVADTKKIEKIAERMIINAFKALLKKGWTKEEIIKQCKFNIP